MKDFALVYSCASDIGMRMSNQDNYLVDGSPAFRDAYDRHQKSGVLDTGRTQILCVCDGVGGGSRGDYAALTALDAVAQIAGDPAKEDWPLDETLEVAAEAAQKAVTEAFMEQMRPSGCTLVMLGVRGDEWAFLNIGDSPAFLWKADSGQMEELSVRHNLEWEKRRRGEVPKENDGCFLLRYIGKFGYQAAELASTAQGKLREGDRLLLCSDGITNALTLLQLQEAMAGGESAWDMVSRSAQAPGADNCTAICLLVRAKADPA